MSADLAPVLERAALAAFEQLGFLLPDPEVEPVPNGPLTGMRVTFTGPVRGAVEVRADRLLQETLAMNMTGEMEAPSAQLQRDALGEIANVICGNVLPLAEDPSAVFRLSAPERVEASSNRERARVRLSLEGGFAEVRLLEDAP